MIQGISVVIYLAICNWIQIYYLLGNLLKSKKVIKSVDGKGLKNKLKKITGLNVEIKTMSEKEKAIGFMVSSPPFRPIMIFSERMYKLFTKDEFEWVALHESAHYLMWHTIRYALVQFLLLIIGFKIFMELHINTWILIPYMISLSVFYIQIVKRFEYQADMYAIKKMKNPKAMISAITKLRKINGFLNKSNFLYNMLVIQIPYEVRIRMIHSELKLRNQK